MGGSFLTEAEVNALLTTRRQFLQQRRERRKMRDAETSDSGAQDETFSSADTKTNELTDTGMPARLSEVYRRDARRYDTPFERY